MRLTSTRLGEIIRRQREVNRLTLRQFAALAGISNPYLSQIERGLRMPSPEVVHAIARTLKIPVDELYAEAGLSPTPEGDDGRARLAILLETDAALTARQRRVLLDVYDGLVATAATTRPSSRWSRPAEPEQAGQA